MNTMNNPKAVLTRTRPDTPRPPHFLDDVAKKKWEETWHKLDHRYFVFERDSDILTFYCSSYSVWRAACTRLEDGDSVVYDKRGNPAANPLVVIRDTAEERMIELSAQLGLRPDKVVIRGPDWNEYAELLAGDDDNDVGC